MFYIQISVGMLTNIFLLTILNYEVRTFVISACNKTEYYDPSLMSCQACPANASMVTSADGFSCACEEHSVPAGIGRCRTCNATEVVSADGTACVPRKCQNSSGKVVCRRCPNDHIYVTQNIDGSPTKEVICVKCARGYKAAGNACVRCADCVCARAEVGVRGACVARRFVRDRPKYEEKRLHPTVLLDVVKHEYLCMAGDFAACRKLANECVKNFYMTDLAGPCRLWVQPKIASPNGLPELVIKPSSSQDLKLGEFNLPRGKETFSLVVAVYTTDGGFKFLESSTEQLYRCFLPVTIRIGIDFLYECEKNITDWALLDSNSTYAVYIDVDGTFKPLPVLLRTPGGYYVQRGNWNTNHFRRFFFVDNALSPVTNDSRTVYLSKLLIHVRIEREKHQHGSLRVHISIEVQYTSKSPLSQLVTTTMSVQHDMPTAGIFRGLEIWGGVLGALLSLYAVVQWRGEMRRGGSHFSLLPLLAGAIADALYFATWFSTLHALAAEAGTLGMTLPLSRVEEHIIRALVYSGLSLKVIKVTWLNWKQCRVDIFFLDWSEYNSPVKDSGLARESNWKATTLAREWSRLQTLRRAPPSYTVFLALLILQLMTPWQRYLPKSQGYRWAIASIAWLSSYVVLLCLRWIMDRAVGPPSAVLTRVCRETGFSFLVFQEEYYAHYVQSRNDDIKDLRMMAGPLAMCRIIMAAPLRIVYKQLSAPGVADDLGNIDARRVMLTRLLAAFFERALDGLNWVANERTMPERLLDVELTEREAGSTSVLLYDPADGSPSCMAVTWWGEEWTLGTFDAMLFGSVIVSTDNSLLATFVTLSFWQAMKRVRLFFGNKNQKFKTNIESTIHE